ncbi:MAG: serine/threonine protein kinase [Cyanobacteria bacterium]|nr:serine/threonine protein kinase [Cyanobacteriota bacterium]MDW8201669.1 serine/threonine-protein kinase [Cyanobacteriota bacterium SKYGB_h_bin112]
MTISLTPGSTIAQRYRVVQLLGEGGFGRAYLAEDLNRFGELCLMKEFAPQVQGADALAKARELFQREAGVLYQLKHPQIPEFRELLQVRWQGQESLFLVQQYIQGVTYWELLQQGRRFEEATIRQLLLDILPVLSYIHDRGVIHRDIAPDNLIQQAGTGKPVLIDFGGVKQVAISAVHHLAHQPMPTHLFKAGYTPPEQMRGYVQPASDLYALAVTMLVLLTGRPPTELYNSYRGDWQWQMIPISPELRSVLARMLADRIENRYPTAEAVIQALTSATPLPAKTMARSRLMNHLTALPTLVVSPWRQRTVYGGHQDSRSAPVPTQSYETEANGSLWTDLRAGLGMLVRVTWWTLRTTVLLLLWVIKAAGLLVEFLFNSAEFVYRTITLLLALAVIGGLFALTMVLRGAWQPPDWFKVPSSKAPKLQFPSLKFPDLNWPFRSSAQSCQQRVVARYKALKISAEELRSLYRRVDEQLYARYPELQGRPLTERPEDDRFRQVWCQLADSVLDSMEKDRNP